MNLGWVVDALGGKRSRKNPKTRKRKMFIEKTADVSPAVSAQSEDVEVVDRAQQGDPVAFAKLVTKYRGRVLTRLYNMIQNEEDTLEISQTVFVKVWRTIGRFEGKSSFYTWLYTVATREALEWLRRSRPRFVELDFELRSPVAHPDREVQRNEVRQCILDAVAKLSPKQRAVIVLKDPDDLQYSEIAETLERSIGTVMSRLFHAGRKLRILLRPLYESLLSRQGNGRWRAGEKLHMF